MRAFLLVVLLLVLGVAGFGYYKNPIGCEKLGLDVSTDILAIYLPADSTNAAPAASASSPPAPSPAAAPSVPVIAPSAPAQPPLPVVSPSSAPPTTTTAPVQPQYPVGYVATPTAAVPTVAPVAVTPAVVQQPISLPHDLTDYDTALDDAKKYHVPLLILFTGSDWCPYCQKLEQEVLSTGDFSSFTSTHFVFLTIDDLRNSPVADDDKQRISQLERKFNISGFPTLVLIDTDEHEKGRMEGYDPGSGPSSVISQLQQIASR
jgi:protein disulfide-isomerase